MALFPYNSDPKYSVYDINNSQDLRETSQRCDYIQIGLRLYSHLFCRGFIFHYFLYLFIYYVVYQQSFRNCLLFQSTRFTPFLLLNLKFPVECFVHLFYSPVFFWQLHCLSFDLYHTITLWYLETFLIISLYQTFFFFQPYFHSKFK